MSRNVKLEKWTFWLGTPHGAPCLHSSALLDRTFHVCSFSADCQELQVQSPLESIILWLLIRCQMYDLQEKGVAAIRAAPSSGKTVLLKAVEALAKEDSRVRNVYFLDVADMKSLNIAFALKESHGASWANLLQNRRCIFFQLYFPPQCSTVSCTACKVVASHLCSQAWGGTQDEVSSLVMHMIPNAENFHLLEGLPSELCNVITVLSWADLRLKNFVWMSQHLNLFTNCLMYRWWKIWCSFVRWVPDCAERQRGGEIKSAGCIEKDQGWSDSEPEGTVGLILWRKGIQDYGVSFCLFCLSQLDVTTRLLIKSFWLQSS